MNGFRQRLSPSGKIFEQWGNSLLMNAFCLQQDCCWMLLCEHKYYMFLIFCPTYMNEGWQNIRNTSLKQLKQLPKTSACCFSIISRASSVRDKHGAVPPLPSLGHSSKVLLYIMSPSGFSVNMPACHLTVIWCPPAISLMLPLDICSSAVLVKS